ncbi:MAG: molybdenum ABC transporter ATP-binding protein [Oceanospirillaceae bacterium]|nr:molybdenum ABC transporter ATP-binding protein [Oceanospirillaceae bacterium]MBT13657.1 molybdenum ABC transporter ATP-binding protein [Oceanospirillaceae bacterium]|tara:strand:- start:63101 stop:64210 length:1110 start_codon:yes stop_codon:yes gene_type:complete
MTAETTDKALTLQLTLFRPDFTLDVDLQLPPTGVSVLFGHSGSGKTTLLRCIAGLEQAAGSVHFGRQPWQTADICLPTFKRPLAYVFQESSLFEHLTAADNLQFACKRAGTAPTRQEYQDIVALLGIGQVLHKYPQQLSGGERQRVAIARALLNKPQLLLMDEPLASLDEQRKREILPYLEQLKTHLQLPMVYVTHSAAEVARLADYLVALKDGKVVAQGDLADTLTRLDFPLTPGDEAGIVLQGTVVERDDHWQLVKIGFGHHSAHHPSGEGIWLRAGDEQTGQPVRARILARDVSLALTPRDDSSIQNCLPCTLVEIGNDEHPALALIKVMVGDTPFLSRMTRRSVSQLQLTAGMKVWAQVKSAALL